MKNNTILIRSRKISYFLSFSLRLFRHFNPFRVLVCSGDGSVGWVLSEIDRLNMQVKFGVYFPLTF